jgi:hypothetical protein
MVTILNKCFPDIFFWRILLASKIDTLLFYRKICYVLNVLEFSLVTVNFKANLTRWFFLFLCCHLYFWNQISGVIWTVFLTIALQRFSTYSSLSAIPILCIAQLQATFYISEEHDFIIRDVCRSNTFYYKMSSTDSLKTNGFV